MAAVHPARRRSMMAGNWKMNFNHLEAIAHVQKLAFSLRPEEIAEVEVVVLPPFTDLRSVQTLVQGDHLDIEYGAQDLSAHDAGAYTGEVSGAMLAKLGCRFVLVGHSERRQYHGEDDALVNAKVHAALRHGLEPIICVGEGLETRKACQHIPHTLRQLDAALEGVPAERASGLVVAYEPVWAIGTGMSAEPEDAHEMAAAIRGRLGERFSPEAADAVRVLYGGSVNGPNVAAIMAGPDVDGGLVGSASLDVEAFVEVVHHEQASR